MMKTFTITTKVTVDLYSAKEAADWLEDVLESNFSEDGEEVHSVKAVAAMETGSKTNDADKIQRIKDLLVLWGSGELSSADFADDVESVFGK
jgi:disulfide oxidoreductase YuzD